MTNAIEVELTAPAVQGDLPCGACGYNLRTRDWDASCPECRRPVRESAPPAGFRFTNRAAAERVLRGFGWIALSFVMLLAGELLFHLSVRYEHLLSSLENYPIASMTYDVLSWSRTCQQAFCAVGIFIALGPLKKSNDTSPHRRLRMIAIAMAIVSFISSELTDYTRFVRFFQSSIHHFLLAIYRLEIVAMLLLWIYLRRMVDNRANKVLVRNCDLVFLGILVGWSGMLTWMVYDGARIFWYFEQWFDTGLRDWLRWWGSLVGVPGMFCFLVGAWYYVRRLSTALRQIPHGSIAYRAAGDLNERG